MGLAAAGIGAAGSIVGGIAGGKGAKKAAKIQAEAAKYAADLQYKQFEESRADLAPWREAGGKAIGQLSDMLKPGYDYTASPGYQFRLNEGLKGVQNSAAARGILQSGGTLKGLTKYGQDYAANDFNDSFNRVASVAAGGQQVNSTLASLGANAATNAGNFATQGANARASGYIGQANSLSNMFNQLGTIGMNYFNNQPSTFNLPSWVGSGKSQPIPVYNNPDYTYG